MKTAFMSSIGLGSGWVAPVDSGVTWRVRVRPIDTGLVRGIPRPVESLSREAATIGSWRDQMSRTVDRTTSTDVQTASGRRGSEAKAAPGSIAFAADGDGGGTTVALGSDPGRGALAATLER